MVEQNYTNTEGQIVCPYCGHKHEDDGFYYDESETNCEKCDKLFGFTFDMKAYFTSKKI